MLQPFIKALDFKNRPVPGPHKNRMFIEHTCTIRKYTLTFSDHLFVSDDLHLVDDVFYSAL